MRGRGSLKRVRGLSVLLGTGVLLASPLATSPAAAASKQPVTQPIVIQQTVLIDPAAATFLIEAYLAVAGLAAAIILYALIWARTAERRVARRDNRRQAKAAAVWSDALVVPARPVRSAAPHAGFRRSLRAASAPPA